jgi:hypothetical protein
MSPMEALLKSRAVLRVMRSFCLELTYSCNKALTGIVSNTSVGFKLGLQIGICTVRDPYSFESLDPDPGPGRQSCISLKILYQDPYVNTRIVILIPKVVSESFFPANVQRRAGAGALKLM